MGRDDQIAAQKADRGILGTKQNCARHKAARSD